jgi:uncharacterized membrane protein (DUF373 family)
LQDFLKQCRTALSDESFLGWISQIEVILAKILSIFMVIVILVTVIDLGVFLVRDLLTHSWGRFSNALFEIFGLFLNILIALELLANITAYLRKHVAHVELVIVTALIAVARKLIILDLDKTAGLDLIALGIAIFAISISYWIVHRVSAKSHD